MLTYQSSSFISYIRTNVLRGTCDVQFKDGKFYTYYDVSRRALLNLEFNKSMSLGFWFNRNLIDADYSLLFDVNKVYAWVTWFSSLLLSSQSLSPYHNSSTFYSLLPEMTTPNMFSLYYSDDDHDHFFIDSPSMFEATCEFYYMIDDSNEGEWITIRDENDNIIKENY